MLTDRTILLELSTSKLALRDLLKPGGKFWFWESRYTVRYGHGETLYRQSWHLRLGRETSNPWRSFSRPSDIRKVEFAGLDQTTKVPRTMLKLMRGLPRLETLLLTSCVYDAGIHHFICHCPSLKHLTIHSYTVPDEHAILPYPGTSTSTSLATLIIDDQRLVAWTFHQRAASKLNTLLRSLPLSTLQHLHLQTRHCYLDDSVLRSLIAVLGQDSLLTLDVACESIPAPRGLADLLRLQLSITELTIGCTRDVPFPTDLDLAVPFPSLRTLDTDACVPVSMTEDELRRLTTVRLRGFHPATERFLDRMISTAGSSATIALRHLRVTLPPKRTRELVRHILASFPLLVIFEVHIPGTYLPEGLLESDIPDALSDLPLCQRLTFSGTGITHPDFSLSSGPDETRIPLDAQLGLIQEWGRRCEALRTVMLGGIEWVRIEASEEWKAYDRAAWDIPLCIQETSHWRDHL